MILTYLATYEPARCLRTILDFFWHTKNAMKNVYWLNNRLLESTGSIDDSTQLDLAMSLRSFHHR